MGAGPAMTEKRKREMTRKTTSIRIEKAGPRNAVKRLMKKRGWRLETKRTRKQEGNEGRRKK